MTTTAYIYDAVRTPRSKGKKDGTLHEVKPVDLGGGLLRALQSRQDLDTSYVDDVVMGGVSLGRFKVDLEGNGVFYGTVSVANNKLDLTL